MSSLVNRKAFSCSVDNGVATCWVSWHDEGENIQIVDAQQGVVFEHGIVWKVKSTKAPTCATSLAIRINRPYAFWTCTSPSGRNCFVLNDGPAEETFQSEDASFTDQLVALQSFACRICTLPQSHFIYPSIQISRLASLIGIYNTIASTKTRFCHWSYNLNNLLRSLLLRTYYSYRM